MSGMAAILNLDGAPVERPLLRHLTNYMTFRGPDAQEVWQDGPIGLGHTMLRTTWEAEYEQQPFTLDQQVWIVADARIDDRETLAEKLEIPFTPLSPLGKGGIEGAVVTDVEFILRAYLTWGDDCVHHLLGDFVFVIWDSRHQRLFCARDQFGVKLFYYSRVGHSLLISNTLNCLRQHSHVSSALNEAAIGDFLLFDMNYNLETTTFADIQRMPPAHTLTYANDTLKIEQYWTLPLPELVRYKNDQDYIDRFKELMGKAVGDRLRQEKVSIYLSGGLDSTTVAATAVKIAKQQSLPLDLQAFTVVYDQLIPDQERYYSGIAAKALNIPIHYCVADNYQLYEGWERPEFQFPEPCHAPFGLMDVDQTQAITTHSRVALHGEGGDEALKGKTVVELAQCMPPISLLQDIGNSLLNHQLSPNWGTGVLARLRQWRGDRDEAADQYPVWINPDFATRQNLADRWQQIWLNRPKHPPLPRGSAYYSLSSPVFRSLWASIFEVYDASWLMAPLEVRFPFLDLRLLSYLLALPPIPWCVGKQLLRVATQDALPETIRQRDKSPLSGDPLASKLEQGQQLRPDLSSSLLKSFIHPKALVQLDEKTQRPVWASETGLRAISLSYWLNQVTRSSTLSMPLIYH